MDVTGQDSNDNVEFGDEVVLFGRQGNQEIYLEELESSTGIPTCEIMLAIGTEGYQQHSHAKSHCQAKRTKFA